MKENPDGILLGPVTYPYPPKNITDLVPCKWTIPPDVGPGCRRNFIPRRSNLDQNQTGLPDPNPKPTPAWLGGWVRWRHATTKKYAFLYVFSRAAKNIRMVTFSLRFSAIFEQAELPGTQTGPNGPPNAKGTAYIATEIANSQKSGHLGHFGHLGLFRLFRLKRPFFLSFWQAISEPGWTRRKKVPTRALLVSTRPSYVCFWSKLDPPEAGQKNRRPGL